MDGAARTQIRHLRYMKSIRRPNVLVRMAVRAFSPFYVPLIDSFSNEKKNRVESVSRPLHTLFLVFSIFFFNRNLWCQLLSFETYMYPGPVQHLRIHLLLPTTTTLIRTRIIVQYSQSKCHQNVLWRLPNAPSSCILRLMQFQSSTVHSEWQEWKRREKK